ncbi:unnamed protein product [Musa acuminata var. zebrina]
MVTSCKEQRQKLVEVHEKGIKVAKGSCALALEGAAQLTPHSPPKHAKGRVLWAGESSILLLLLALEEVGRKLKLSTDEDDSLPLERDKNLVKYDFSNLLPGRLGFKRGDSSGNHVCTPFLPLPRWGQAGDRTDHQRLEQTPPKHAAALHQKADSSPPLHVHHSLLPIHERKARTPSASL